MGVQEIVLLLCLTVAAILIVVGVALAIGVGAAFIVAGAALGSLSWLVLGDIGDVVGDSA